MKRNENQATNAVSSPPLLECPFCGSDSAKHNAAVTKKLSWHLVVLSTVTCPCGVTVESRCPVDPLTFKKDKSAIPQRLEKEVVEKWNKRASNSRGSGADRVGSAGG